MYPPYFAFIFFEPPLPPHDQLEFLVHSPHDQLEFLRYTPSSPPHPPHRNEKNVSVLVTDQHRKNRQLHLSIHGQNHLQSDVTHLQLERLVWYESYRTRFFKGWTSKSLITMSWSSHRHLLSRFHQHHFRPRRRLSRHPGLVHQFGATSLKNSDS